MKLSSEELKALYRSGTARSSHEHECPSADELVQAANGELSSVERERVINHLAVCSDCAEEYQVIGSLRPWAKEQASSLETPAIIDAAARPRLAPAVVSALPREEDTRSLSGVTSWWLGRRKPSGPGYLSYAIAATLLILTLTIGAIAFFLQREKSNLVAQYDERLAERDRMIAAKEDEIAAARKQIEESERAQKEEAARRQKETGPGAVQERTVSSPNSAREQPIQRQRSVVEPLRPQLNVPIIDLDPGDSVRSGSGATPRTIEIPADANMFTLILNINGDPKASTYSIEINNRRGARVWRGGGLRKSQYNTFTVALTRRAFPAGEYQIKLYGLSDGREQLIQSYSVRIQYV